MLSKISLYSGLALLSAGYFWLRTSRASEDAMSLSLALMGAGALLLLFHFYRFAAGTSEIVKSIDPDKKVSDHLTGTRLRFVSIAAMIIGAVGMQLSPGGYNHSTLGFLGLIAAGGLVYLFAYTRYGGPGSSSNVFRLVIMAAAVFGLMASVITLIFQLSGTSNMPTRWNIYTCYGLLGLAASIYGGYYGIAYQTNTDILEMLAPLGFTLADSGPLGRDGKFDARGVWKGVDTLVNVNQNDPYKNIPAYFDLEVSCEVKGWSGRRLLVHPGGYLNRPLGTPLALPKAQPVAGWEKFGVYCDPPEEAPALLTAIGSRAGFQVAGEKGFSFLLLDKGRLVFGFSRNGYPSLSYLRKMMEAAANSAAALR